MKNIPKKPTEGKVSRSQGIKFILVYFLYILLHIVLVVASLNILAYYLSSTIHYGWLNSETVKYALYLVIGSYFFLVVDNKKIRELLGIKKLPWI